MQHNLNPEDLSRKALLRIVERTRRILVKDFESEGLTPGAAAVMKVNMISTALEDHAIGPPEEE